jgi:hypothetical protein
MHNTFIPNQILENHYLIPGGIALPEMVHPRSLRGRKFLWAKISPGVSFYYSIPALAHWTMFRNWQPKRYFHGCAS